MGNQPDWPDEDQILDAIRDAISAAMPSEDAILEAIKNGTDIAFPYPSEIREAIRGGAYDALKDGRG